MIKCWEDTKKYADNFTNPPLYKYDPDMYLQKQYDTKIKIDNIDSIDCGIALQKTGLDPVVLNLADIFIAGGCVDLGTDAQEESIFRRTNLFKTLRTESNLYPIEDGEAILSRKVNVLKSSEKKGWKLLSKPLWLDFIACPGIYMPILNYLDEKSGIENARLKDQDVERLKIKIKTILQIAYQNRNDAIVLGALSCDAWCNPALHTAEIFEDILKEYHGVFKRIHFAILKNVDDMYMVRYTLNTNGNRKDNYEIFKKVFADK